MTLQVEVWSVLGWTVRASGCVLKTLGQGPRTSWSSSCRAMGKEGSKRTPGKTAAVDIY